MQQIKLPLPMAILLGLYLVVVSAVALPQFARMLRASALQQPNEIDILPEISSKDVVKAERQALIESGSDLTNRLEEIERDIEELEKLDVPAAEVYGRFKQLVDEAETTKEQLREIEEELEQEKYDYTPSIIEEFFDEYFYPQPDPTPDPDLT